MFQEKYYPDFLLGISDKNFLVFLKNCKILSRLLDKNSKHWGCEKSGVKILHFPQPPVYAVTLPAADSQMSILPLTP